MADSRNPISNLNQGQRRWRLPEGLRLFRKREETADNEKEADDSGENATPPPPPRNSSRRVFGFLCDPQISAAVRFLSKELVIPIYPVTEHALGLGCAQIAQDLREESSRQALFTHLTHEHFLKPTLTPDNTFDVDSAMRMRKAQLRRWELDRMAHDIAEAVAREGISPRFLLNLARQLIHDARQRRYTHGNTPPGRKPERKETPGQASPDPGSAGPRETSEPAEKEGEDNE